MLRVRVGFLVALLSLLPVLCPAAAPWDPPGVTLITRQLMPGVYAVLPDDADKSDHVATTGGIVVWLPAQKVLWAGNVIQAPPPALPWLLEGRHRETMATLKRIRAFLPQEAIIIPGHDRPMRPPEIAYAVRYLEELDRKVGAAIAAGRSLEETRRAVPMLEYGNYSLFKWVHNEVNLPAVYKPLNK